MNLGRGWTAPADWPTHWWLSAAERCDDDPANYDGYQEDHDGHDSHDGQVDKTELDDIRSGMEKERCKINYFQVIKMIKRPQ